jgi:hypothetical protein
MAGWWPGDGNTSDLVNGNNGIITGTVSYADPGMVDQAFSIGSPSGAIRIPDNVLLEPAELTVDAWVRATNPGAHRYIVSKGANACAAASYALYTGPGGGLTFYISDGSTVTMSTDAGTGVWDGQWHHVAGTFDGATARLYVDGLAVGGGTAALSGIGYGLPSGNDLLIGNYAESACPGVGFSLANSAIDEVELYSRALSATEIWDIFNAGSNGRCKMLEVAIDIKPGSDTNCFNINGHGVIPVAILGTRDFDVSRVDPATLSFGGLGVRVRGKKGPLCSFGDSNADGYPDLVCHFEDDPNYWAPGNGEASLTGKLLPEFGANAFEGSGPICTVPLSTTRDRGR